MSSSDKTPVTMQELLVSNALRRKTYDHQHSRLADGFGHSIY
jgi:hypothetical protein